MCLGEIGLCSSENTIFWFLYSNHCNYIPKQQELRFKDASYVFDQGIELQVQPSAELALAPLDPRASLIYASKTRRVSFSTAQLDPLETMELSGA